MFFLYWQQLRQNTMTTNRKKKKKGRAAAAAATRKYKVENHKMQDINPEPNGMMYYSLWQSNSSSVSESSNSKIYHKKFIRVLCLCVWIK